MSIKAVIFDMDGTLFDTEKLLSECMIEAASEEGWKLEWDTVVGCIGTTYAETERIIMEAMGKDFPYDRIKTKGVDRLRSFSEKNGVPFKAGVRRLFDRLKDRRMPIGLATTTERRDVEELLTAAGLIDDFSAIVCGDEVVNGKPDPEIYLKAAEKMSIDMKDVLVFEDSAHGIESASAAGARVVWVPDLQDLNDTVRGKCYREIGSLDAACDRLGELLV